MGEDARLQIQDPAVLPRFDVHQLVSRRSFVFARAGFGKSNLVKLLFADLYGNGAGPAVPKRGGREAPVGTVIFDPDGEYYWPDDKERPGLCDVPELQNRLAVFTDKEADSAFYQSFVVDKVKLDIRELQPSKVISLVIPPERQDNQNVVKLKGLRGPQWRGLVDAVYAKRGGTDLQVFTMPSNSSPSGRRRRRLPLGPIWCGSSALCTIRPASCCPDCSVPLKREGCVLSISRRCVALRGSRWQG